MEHADKLKEILNEAGVIIDDTVAVALARFGMQVLRENSQFNLTGYKNINDILKRLIAESIIPLEKVNVPRGTVFCDLGTGAGVPGVPLAVLRQDMQAVLVDSSAKKCDFIDRIYAELGLDNAVAVNARAEEVGRDPQYREVFGLVVSRAMGSPYIVIETGGPLVSPGGLLYIYSLLFPEELHPECVLHARELGLEAVQSADYERFGVRKEGLLFIKKRSVPEKYPRRFAVIKREAGRIGR